MYKLVLCWRYLLTRYLALVCIVSVMLGVATLIVVNSVMAGFSTKLKERLHGLLSDLSIESYGAGGFDRLDEKIEAIRRLVDSRIEIQHYRYPRVGERARILDGPFKDIEGLIVKADPRKDLFVITIEILQRAVAIELKGFEVERI